MGGAVWAVLESRGTPWQLLHDYQYRRIDTFLDPTSDPLGKGFHIIQSEIAIGSGGLGGQGLFEGRQTQGGFIPFQETDFVFSVAGEELGFLGAAGIVVLIAFIVVRCVVVARRADAFGRCATRRTPWAEALRLDLWLRRSEEAGGGFSVRLPFVLTHRRPDAEAAPAAALADVVDAHLGRAGIPMAAEAAWPLRLRRTGPPDGGAVTVVIPSTLRRPHALRCITAVLRGTAHPRFRVHVAVSQAEPLDETQREAARRIEAHSNAEVTWLRAERFNFSWVNNRVIERTDGENVLLLNDDVSPTAPDWLDWMAAYLADPAVGVVGARLLYPGGAVQHGGVIMGLAGLCDHAHRHLPGNQPGYAWRAVLPQELSAVTAACMLVRRRLLREVGGLDEAYPSAFNDVDLALRVREAGYAVIYAPQAELIHHELQTYGSHYAGDRQPFFTAEVERMRTRWADVCAADPFHNPNLGLEPGREWQLAFPPRVDLSG